VIGEGDERDGQDEKRREAHAPGDRERRADADDHVDPPLDADRPEGPRGAEGAEEPPLLRHAEAPEHLEQRIVLQHEDIGDRRRRIVVRVPDVARPGQHRRIHHRDEQQGRQQRREDAREAAGEELAEGEPPRRVTFQDRLRDEEAREQEEDRDAEMRQGARAAIGMGEGEHMLDHHELRRGAAQQVDPAGLEGIERKGKARRRRGAGRAYR
jgi:hypothetical protein